ncbi:MAG: potassium channel family protein [Actinobacteria bacterium]|nr:potassium channel family protein [Actinomycetota bacterium]
MKAANWRKRTALPTLILSLLYTFTYVVPIYFYPLNQSLDDFFRWANYAIWAYFVLDYLIQLFLASNKFKFFKTHIVELILVVVPFFRPLRALRALLFTTKAGFRTRKTYVRSIPILITGTTILMILIMGAAVLDIERPVPGSHIKTPSDALWWALVTVTTIGYGDVYPVTNQGRLVAGVLIIFGVAMISTLTASFAAWILVDHEASA